MIAKCQDEDSSSYVLRLSLATVNSSTATFDYYITKTLDDDVFDAMSAKDEIEADVNEDLLNFKFISNLISMSSIDGSIIIKSHESLNRLQNGVHAANTFDVDGLNSSTVYEITLYLHLNYTSNSSTARDLLRSNTIRFETFDKCNCNTKGVQTLLNPSSVNQSCIDDAPNICICKSCYRGDSCDKCNELCYLNEFNTCDKCPCDLSRSNGKCGLIKDAANPHKVLIKCDACNWPYIGLLCNECDIGFYKTSDGICAPCICNNNTEDNTNKCDDLTGK